MRFIVVCQHQLFSTSLCDIVRQYKEGIDIIKSSSVIDALDVISKPIPTTLIVFYMQLVDSAWENLAHLHQQAPQIPILVIADFENDEQIRKAIYTGANGCVSTNFTWRTVTFVIQRIIDGEIVSPSIHFKVEKSDERTPRTISNKPIKQKSTNTNIKLTPRQLQVLRLIQSGQSNKEIARALDMAVSTVKIHCAAIFKEMGVKNRTQAAIDAENYF